MTTRADLTAAQAATLDAIAAILEDGRRATAHAIAGHRGMLLGGTGRDTGVRTAVRRSLHVLSRHRLVVHHLSPASTVFSDHDDYTLTDHGKALAE